MRVDGVVLHVSTTRGLKVLNFQVGKKLRRVKKTVNTTCEF